VNLTTAHHEGIVTARRLHMAADFLTLLRRDHHDLERALDELLDPGATVVEIRGALDGIRLGLTAHAEAEDIVLYQALLRAGAGRVLEEVVDEARTAHLAQEAALAALVCAPPGTDTWRDRALHLRRLVVDHAVWEEEYVVGAIRRAAPQVYAELAGAFATERLRQLAMLQPSAPIYVPELAQAS
jgi:hypothetical protein